MEKKTKKTKFELLKESGSIPTATVALGIRYEPELVGTTICPHCNFNQEDYYTEAELNKTLYTACEKCGEEFFIDIPDFKL